MSQPLNLENIAHQLDSENLRDRLLALVSLRDVPPEDAVPLIKKVLNDESLQVRSMAVFALGIKPTEECYPLLVNLLETDPDYGVRADAAGALGYLGDIRAFEPLVRAFYEDTDWLVRFSAAVSLGNLTREQIACCGIACDRQRSQCAQCCDTGVCSRQSSGRQGARCNAGSRKILDVGRARDSDIGGVDSATYSYATVDSQCSCHGARGISGVSDIGRRCCQESSHSVKS